MMEQPPEVQPDNSISTRVALGMESVISGLPEPPAELGWLTVIGVIISLFALIRKR